MQCPTVCELNPSRRRPRDEMEDPEVTAYGPSSFVEHRNVRGSLYLPNVGRLIDKLALQKRIMSGTSNPATKQFPSFPPAADLPETLNPPHAAGHSHHPPEPSPHAEPQPAPAEDTNMDMDMTQAPSPAGDRLASPALPAGRIPTPIQPSFMTQVHGNSWADVPETEHAHHPNGVHNLGHQPTPFALPPASDQSVPRTVGADEWNAVRNRRLPSPISEGEDAHVRGHSPGMVLDGSTTNLAHRLASQASITTPGEQKGDPMGEAGAHEAETANGEAGPTTPSPGRKGHTRSRHTIDSWTWQPGMKKTFSMGYRTDCEKCRMKVPGHFNHIIIS